MRDGSVARLNADVTWLISELEGNIEDDLNDAGTYPANIQLPLVGPNGSTIEWFYTEVGGDVIIDSSVTPNNGPDADGIIGFDDVATASTFRAEVSYGSADEVVTFTVSYAGGVFTIVEN
ncbi:hypothetical protein E9840_11530 [Tissierella creatinini]|nr:hypothetical protein E9840_11530 [Tissierella creatinini]